MDKLKTTIATFDKYANEYQEKYSRYEPYLESYRKFSLLLKPTDTVLDVACGPGSISQVLLQRYPGLKIRGLDLSPRMLQVARERIPQGHFEQRDTRTISEITQRFDALVCGFGLPYLCAEEVQKFFEDARGLMKDGGYLYVSAQLGDYENTAFQSNGSNDHVYTYYYQEEFLTNILCENNFKIINVEKNTIHGATGESTEEIFFHAKRH